jgi:hypothetical protein
MHESTHPQGGSTARPARALARALVQNFGNLGLV